ncbi:MAG: Veg family protein [Coriobacteriia bacterium]
MSEVRAVDVVSRIRSDLENMMGDRMRLKANLGRSRIVERVGTLEEIHPSLFVVSVEEKRNRKARVSYSYADVLTGTVQLIHPETEENLLPWLN